MSDQAVTDPLTDPKVVAARARVTTVERTRERFAEPTAEAVADSTTAAMRIFGRFDSDGAPWGISAQDVAAALDELPAGTDRLDVHIHSRGGDAFEGLAVYNLLRNADIEVHTFVDGLAASAASAVAMAGKTITMSPSSQLMIHDASGIGMGQAEDMRILATALDSISDSYAAAYAARTGGTVAEWRAAMQPETWYRAEEAVKAGLADEVAAKAKLTPTAVAASLDLSVFAYAGRDNAPDPFMPAARADTKTPAEPPVTPPTDHKEADAMSDTENKGLRERLGLAEDADEATVLAKVDELLDTATKPDPAPAAAAEIPEGHVVVSQLVLDELKEGAKAGTEARAKQLAEERDEAIQAAVTAGKISRERVPAWTASWNKDAEGTKADLESLPARFPVGPTQGIQGDDGTPGANAAVFTDDEADALAALTGTRKEALQA